jgi:hypothetical protein
MRGFLGEAASPASQRETAPPHPSQLGSRYERSDISRGWKMAPAEKGGLWSGDA